MNYPESSRRIRQLLAKASNTNPEDWYLCLKARQGMQLIFQSIYELYGESEVITQSYTCITAVNPILSAKLKPVYADIDPKTLAISNPSAKLYRKDHTRAIVMQHTLGIMGNKDKVVSFADKHKLLLIEDSAHALTRMYRLPNKKVAADFSIHSFGVEKILTRTKFGGAIYINPRLRETYPELHKSIAEAFLHLKQPSFATDARLHTYRFNNAILQRVPLGMKPAIRDISIKAHILEAPVAPQEQDGKQAPAQATNLWVNKKILEHLPTLPLNYDRRIANVAKYHKKLKSDRFAQLTSVKEPLLAFPILFEDVKHANLAYDLLSASGFFIRRWYSPLLYPGPNNNRLYNYSPKNTPIAEDISKRVLCLPTDIKTEDCDRLISLINQPKK